LNLPGNFQFQKILKGKYLVLRIGHHMTSTARILGVTRVTVGKQIKEFGINLNRRVDLSDKEL